MSLIFDTGVTSQSVDVMIVDDVGLAVTGLVAATFPTLTYSLAGPNADVAFPALSDLAAITTAYASGGVKERGNGVYRLDLPNGVFTTAGKVTVRGEATGKHVLIPRISVGVVVASVSGAVNSVTTGVNATQINGDSTAAANLASQFNGTGLVGTTYPSRQDQVANIAVTGAALNKIAASLTLTTGTDTGGVANTATLDGVFDNWADSGGTIDGYYQFDLSGTTNAVAVGVTWDGYLVGVVNTLKAYAYNWVNSAWDQVGTVVGMSGAVVGAQEFDLTSAHTGTAGNAGLVRIRFQNTGLVTATLKTDRILVGYVVTPNTTTPPTAAAIATVIWQDLTASADFGTAGSIGALLKLDIDAAISSRLATSGYTTPPTAASISGTLLDTVNTAAAHNVTNSVGKQLRTAGGRTTVIWSGIARAGSTATTIVLDTGASAVNNAYQWDVVSITGGTGAGQSSLITSYAGGATKTATVEDAWSPIPDATSTFEITPTTDTRVVNYGVGQDPATLVLDVAAAAHNIAGTIGADINNAAVGGGGDTPGTTTLLARLTAGRATNLDNLDVTVSSRSTYAGGDTAGTSTLLTRLTALRADYLDNLSVGPVATHADATSIDSDVLSRASATVAPAWYTAPVDVSANVTAIKAKTDQLTFTGGNVNAVTAGDSPGVTTLLSRIGGPITISGGMVAVDQSGIADAMLKRDWTEVSGEASSSMLNALRKLRNKWSLVVTPGSLVVYKEDGNSIAYTEVVTTTPTAQPITSMG